MPLFLVLSRDQQRFGDYFNRVDSGVQGRCWFLKNDLNLPLKRNPLVMGECGNVSPGKPDLSRIRPFKACEASRESGFA
jgi:hypothetical protein